MALSDGLGTLDVQEMADPAGLLEESLATGHREKRQLRRISVRTVSGWSRAS